MKIYVQVTDDKNQTYEGIVELTKSKKQVGHKQIKIIISGPTDAFKKLYLQKYFENSRNLNNVEEKIKSMKYNFDVRTIEMALNRSKFLKRNGKRGSYSYIQKTPPN